MKYNKLVRDKIPEIIEAKGEKVLSNVESIELYPQRLLDKLHEEIAEYVDSDNDNDNDNDRVEELADIMEVVYALASISGVSKAELENACKKKKDEKGGFEKRIILIETSQ